jgi:alkylation response protein AidB-like acyl-CoA dehydrogenase
MYFGLSEEQKSLEESISKYLETNAPLETIKAVADGEKEKAKAIHQGLVDLGISGLMVPEQYGGLELDTLFAAVVAGALGAGTAPSPFTGAYVMAPIALSLAGSDTQKDYWLPKIAGGEAVIGMGLSEYVGAREDAFILANSSGQLFLVDAKSAGIEVVDLITVDKTRDSIEIIFNNVDAEALPGSEKDTSVVNKVIDTGRLMLSADTVGASQVMLDKAVAYSLERKQFGRAIGSFQAVKHMCAEMTAELEPCHSMVWHAAHCQDNIEEEAREMACHLKAHVSEVGQQVSKTSIEVHGGMGFTDEMGLHYWFKRIGLNRQLLGSPELIREEVAKLQGFDQLLVKKK